MFAFLAGQYPQYQGGIKCVAAIVGMYIAGESGNDIARTLADMLATIKAPDTLLAAGTATLGISTVSQSEQSAAEVGATSPIRTVGTVGTLAFVGQNDKSAPPQPGTTG